MPSAVSPEEVFVKCSWLGSAQLVNRVGTVKWECAHKHTDWEARVNCGEKQRARWIREGKATDIVAVLTAVADTERVRAERDRYRQALEMLRDEGPLWWDGEKTFAASGVAALALTDSISLPGSEEKEEG